MTETNQLTKAENIQIRMRDKNTGKEGWINLVDIVNAVLMCGFEDDR